LKVLIDENLSPAIARALDGFFGAEHQVEHMRTKFGAGVRDLDWIARLSEEGGWIIISGDRRITRNKAERNAFRNSRIIGFFLSSGLYKARVVKQLERILSLWDVIESTSATMAGGSIFELPAKSSRVKPL